MKIHKNRCPECPERWHRCVHVIIRDPRKSFWARNGQNRLTGRGCTWEKTKFHGCSTHPLSLEPQQRLAGQNKCIKSYSTDRYMVSTMYEVAGGARRVLVERCNAAWHSVTNVWHAVTQKCENGRYALGYGYLWELYISNYLRYRECI